MIDLANVMLVLLAIPLAGASVYLFAMTLLSGAPIPARQTQARQAQARQAQARQQIQSPYGTVRFDVFVPAHNEESTISAVIASVQQVDWPVDCYRITVIADNCTDATASLARKAGAKVLERCDLTKRGKGYALAFAFAQSQVDDWADAVVIIDADSEISKNLLSAFAERLNSGADAVQAYYGVLNPLCSWRTRLLAIAFAAFHRVRSRARERLQVSAGIRGNGWCVSHELLKQVPYQAFSLTEDIEYGIALGLAGFRVHYADEATVAGLMVSSESASRSQRQRWEGGRWRLIRSHLFPLTRAALLRFHPSLTFPEQTILKQEKSSLDGNDNNYLDKKFGRKLGEKLRHKEIAHPLSHKALPSKDGRVCLDLALDLWVLPLSTIVVILFLLMALATLVSIVTSHISAFLWLGIACGACIALYVLRGWQLSGVGYAGLVDLMRAPAFVAWKLWLLCTRRSMDWVRTKREST